MKATTAQLILFLFIFAVFTNRPYLQTYGYSCTCNYRDTLVMVDTLRKKEEMVLPVQTYVEQNYVKTGNYCGLFNENARSSFFPVEISKPTYVLYDFQQKLVWTSTDNSFHRMEYVLPKSSKVLSSTLIQYDLEPGVFIIVDKKLPVWVCPDIYISGLEYGVRKLVTKNSVVELKSFERIKSIPDSLQGFEDLFNSLSPYTVVTSYPAYPKSQSGRRTGIKVQ